MNNHNRKSENLLVDYQNIIKNKKNRVNKKGIIFSKDSQSINSKNFDIIESEKNTSKKKIEKFEVSIEKIEEKLSEKSDLNNSIDLNLKKKNRIFLNKLKLKNAVDKVIKINKYINIIKEEKSKKVKPFYIINPNKIYDKIFEAIVMTFIFFSVTFIPFKLAFYPNNQWYAYDILEYIIEIFFIIDLFKNFFTAYYDEERVLIFDIKKIFFHYLTGWFVLDLISSIPFKFITGETNSLNKFSKFPKIIKFIKLAKLLRIIKFIKDKKKFDDLLKFKKLKIGYERMFGSIIMSVIIFHSISCFWFIIGNINGDLTPNWINQNNIQFWTVPEQYLVSLYWTIQTVFTVGYGDYGPVNSTERLMATLIMFIGVFIYSFVIGNISSIFSILSNQDQYYLKNMDSLTSILKKYKINNISLINKIKYFIKNFNSIDEKIDEFLDELPDTIKREIRISINKNKILGITYFNNKSNDFLYDIGNNLKSVEYKKDEIIYSKNELATEIYFIKKGSVNFYMKKNKLEEKFLTIKEGFYFGELDIFFYNSKRFFQAKAEEKTELLILKYEILEKLFFKDYVDCGEQMILDSRIRRERIENELLNKGLIKKKIDESSENTESSEYTLSQNQNANINDSNYFNDANFIQLKHQVDKSSNKLDDSIKNKSKNNNNLLKINQNEENKKRGSLFYNNFKDYLELKKKNTNIYSSDRNFKTYLNNQRINQKCNERKILNHAIKIETLTNQYEKIADKYSFLLFNEIKKRRKKTNLLTLNYQSLNKYIPFEQEIEYKTKNNIVSMQNTIRELKNSNNNI